MSGFKILSSRRLEKELLLLNKNPPPGISCCLKDDSQKYVFSASIIGPHGSPYERGIFQLEITATEKYPFMPPHVKFVTPLYHPNVDDGGRICLDILKLPPSGSWKPCFTLEGLLLSIQCLMTHPNPDDPLMPDIAHQYKYSKEEFDKDAKKWTAHFAGFNAVSANPIINPSQKPDDRDNKRKSDSDSSEESNSKRSNY